LAQCAAVTGGNVYQLPGNAEAWDSPVPSGVLGALWLANILHGDLVSDADCNARINEYYETFYDFTYSEN
jgi:iron complex transport system substrate-binding protein